MYGREAVECDVVVAHVRIIVTTYSTLKLKALVSRAVISVVLYTTKSEDVIHLDVCGESR